MQIRSAAILGGRHVARRSPQLFIQLASKCQCSENRTLNTLIETVCIVHAVSRVDQFEKDNLLTFLSSVLVLVVIRTPAADCLLYEIHCYACVVCGEGGLEILKNYHLD